MINNDVFGTLQDIEATIFYLDSDYYPGQVPVQDVAGVQELIASCIKHLNKLQQKVNADAINTNSARRRFHARLNSNRNTQLYGYIFRSDMSGTEVLLCSYDKSQLRRCIAEYKELLMHSDEDELWAYADEHNLMIKISDNDEFWKGIDDETGEATGEYYAEINYNTVPVEIIGSDHFRF